MRTWLCADCHFGHQNIIKYCNRPFADAEEMDRCLVANWNACVQPGDTVYFLGDFCFGGADMFARLLEGLNGVVGFIKGNHDKGLSQFVRHFHQPGANRPADRKILFYEKYKTATIEGQTVFLAHFAHRVWDRSHHGSLHAYGHSHGTLPDDWGKSMDVGVDATARRLAAGGPLLKENYRPVSAQEFLSIMAARPVKNEQKKGIQAP